MFNRIHFSLEGDTKTFCGVSLFSRIEEGEKSKSVPEAMETGKPICKKCKRSKKNKRYEISEMIESLMEKF